MSKASQTFEPPETPEIPKTGAKSVAKSSAKSSAKSISGSVARQGFLRYAIVKKDDNRHKMRGFAVRGASGGSNYLFNNARFKGDNQPASRRRDCLRFVQVLIRFCGCGWLKGVGQGKTDRVLSDFRLHYLFGEQFGADGNHFLNPDVNKLMCALIHRARYGVPGEPGIPSTTSVTTPVSIATLFKHHDTFRRWDVNTEELARLGCDQEMLALMFLNSRATNPSASPMELPEL